MRKRSEIDGAFAPREALDGKTSFFLVGIGGAGMSALARMLRHRGHRVRGTDSTASPETERLTDEGIEVRIGHSGEGIEAGDAVIVTDAIDLNASPEIERARELGCPLLRRSQTLGWLLRDKKVIAVTGTHGKTTTTGMLGAGLIAAGVDPLVVVGAAVPEFGGPVREGEGEWAVVEACEAYDSFHDLDPHFVLLTNLELDHVDFHGSYENLRDSVLRFVGRARWLVACMEDEGAREIAHQAAMPIDGYEAEHWDIEAREHGFPDLRPALAGRHNLLNATGAMCAVTLTRADLGKAMRGIAAFTGAERRLQVLREGEITVVDDYAHHPTEIEASLSALRERYPERRLVVVYQPHLYSRTAPMILEFAQALSIADEVYLTDIYPAREDPIPGVSSARIAEAVTKPVRYVPSRHLLPRELARRAKAGDLIVGMGAGNIADFGPALLRELDRIGADRPRRVAVVYGGVSAEREVSILSGRGIQAALKSRGYDSFLVDVAELAVSKGDLSRFVGPDRPDVAVLAVHGPGDEDGTTQALFELLRIPYTGSGILASALAMDKEATKRVLRDHGLRVPEGRLVRSPEEAAGLQPPLVVKPNTQGSTVGLAFVDHEDELGPAVVRALAYDEAALVEELVAGTEISVPVLGDEALPVVEIVPASGRYDFQSKYTPGATEEIVPARLPSHVYEEAQRAALTAHRALGCAGATRTDMIVRGEEVVVLEINTLPGMTSTSLLPNSAAAAGISYEDLVVRMVEDALRRDAAKS